MKKSAVKVLISMMLLMLLIFLSDIFLKIGVISGFYICIILMAHWMDDDWLVVGSTILSIVLTFIAYFIIYDAITLNTFSERFLTTLIIGIVSVLTAKRREIESQLRRSNETLELRVLARTAASEAKSKRLEQQIQILQALRQQNDDASFQALDEVIQTLREIGAEKEDNGR